MRKLILCFITKGLQSVICCFLKQNGYDLQNADVLRYNHLLGKYVVACQKPLIPGYPLNKK